MVQRMANGAVVLGLDWVLLFFVSSFVVEHNKQPLHKMLFFFVCVCAPRSLTVRLALFPLLCSAQDVLCAPGFFFFFFFVLILLFLIPNLFPVGECVGGVGVWVCGCVSV